MTRQQTIRPRPCPARARLADDDLADLVRAAAGGDKRAWHRLVEEFQALIWAVARAHRLDAADAADVSQATWLALLTHLGSLREPARVGAWVATTARRECLRRLRAGELTVPLGEGGDEYESSERLPGQALLLRERDDALRRGLSRLRASDQALLRLLVADPRPSYEEIATALDIPIGSIGPTRQRALERLRQELARQGSLGWLTA
jgi:RNA polymerase sigma factor (sigma-70 family)